MFRKSYTHKTYHELIMTLPMRDLVWLRIKPAEKLKLKVHYVLSQVICLEMLSFYEHYNRADSQSDTGICLNFCSRFLNDF